MKSEAWRWVLGLIYIVVVATIWIVASFVVQSVVDEGVSPFLIAYICNSLFVVYIPLFEIGRYLEDKYVSIFFWRNRKGSSSQDLGGSEEVLLLEQRDTGTQAELNPGSIFGQQEITHHEGHVILESENDIDNPSVCGDANKGLDAKGRWTRSRVAKISLLICPFWFLAQFTFNLSLKYTSVTVRHIVFYTLFFGIVFLFPKLKLVWKKFSETCCGKTLPYQDNSFFREHRKQVINFLEVFFLHKTKTLIVHLFPLI